MKLLPHMHFRKVSIRFHSDEWYQTERHRPVACRQQQTLLQVAECFLSTAEA